MFRTIFVALAAFAITATAASAFTGGGMDLSKLTINLSDTEKSALEQAQTIREEAHDKAEKVLKDAGIDDARMREIHQAMHGARNEKHEAMETALEKNDYAAFVAAIKDSPMAETIDTEAEFQKLREAHELMESGDRDGAKEIMDELGLKPREGMGMGGRGGGMGGRGHGGMGRGMGDQDGN